MDFLFCPDCREELMRFVADIKISNSQLIITGFKIVCSDCGKEITEKRKEYYIRTFLNSITRLK